MEKEQIIEGNKLIAEFMEAWLNETWLDKPTYTYPLKKAPTEHSCYNWGADELKYNTSWDWLMPVIDRVSDVCKPNSKEHYYWNDHVDIRIFKLSKEETYKEVVEFIKWYNQNIQDDLKSKMNPKK